MKSPWRVCPRCNVALDGKSVSFSHSFECPNCGERLRVKQTADKIRGLAVFFISPLLTYEFGLRGLRFIIASALLLWPLGHAAKLIVNALFPPRVMVRPSDDPEINRCPKCNTDVGNRIKGTKLFKCPECGESLKVEWSKGFSILLAGIVLWLFVATPAVSLLGYELGMGGINLALLPLAVFLAGAAIFGLVFKLVVSRTRFLLIKVVPPNLPPSGLGRTELKLNNWKRT